ncbi:hypothetical protein Hdeb2414_s0340g00871991 [Helianthus debilis subsp. tardiflorus]
MFSGIHYENLVDVDIMNLRLDSGLPKISSSRCESTRLDQMVSSSILNPIEPNVEDNSLKLRTAIFK